MKSTNPTEGTRLMLSEEICHTATPVCIDDSTRPSKEQKEELLQWWNKMESAKLTPVVTSIPYSYDVVANIISDRVE